jgi:phosphate starvation-inducible protein PhoH
LFKSSGLRTSIDASDNSILSNELEIFLSKRFNPTLNASNDYILDFGVELSRGTTLDNSIIIVDEFANLNGHELDSIITRVGENSRICFCGDATQSDLIRTSERNGIIDFMSIIRKMPSFDIIEFGIDDVCRSGLVKEYLLAKNELGINL